MNLRQIEELAKLCFDIGKLTLGSLILGLVQSDLAMILRISYGLFGFVISLIFFLIGLNLVKEVR